MSVEEQNEYTHLKTLFERLQASATENTCYFDSTVKSGYADFHGSFNRVLNTLPPLQTSIESVSKNCHKYDVDEFCKGNGYRSIITIVQSCLDHLLLISDQIRKDREKFFFRSYRTYMQLDSYSHVLSRLLTVVRYAIVVMDESEVGCLFSRENSVDESVVANFENLNRECFYGRSFGFQYAESLRQTLNFVAITMAAYGDGYKRHDHPLSRALSSMLHSGKYVVDPELRAKRITELTQYTNIGFCKAFWSLTEEYGVQHAPLLMCPAMSVNCEFTIPNIPITIATMNDGISIDVEIPDVSEKFVGVRARLISYVWRVGQTHENETGNRTSVMGPRPSVKSRYLMLHAHGGGFVAQSSKSHEIYLRYWAKMLNIPILSIDYSLAPEAPFPQALNEIYFAYVWALKNMEKLGSTGQQIVFAGDSAGANLVTACCLKAIEANIRLPDSLVLAYPPLRFQYVPSPSRILSLMDPLLPIGVLKTCIYAYTGEMQNKLQTSYCFNDDDGFNPYVLDIGSDLLNQNGLSNSRSFSETDLSKMKSCFSLNEEFDENESFYSDFPHSGSSVTSLDDVSRSSVENVIGSTENASVEVTVDDCPPSMLRSLTSRVTAKLQDIHSNMSNYLYGSNFHDVKMRIDELPVKTETVVRANGVKNTAPSTPIARENNESLLHKEGFSVCKICLHRREHCACGQDMLLIRARTTRENYRASHHHLNAVSHVTTTCLRRWRSASSILSSQKTSTSNSYTESFIEKTLGSIEQPSVCSPCEDSGIKFASDMGNDYRLSPYMASDELLKKMPPVTIVACTLDPLLDDSVEFTRKLRKLDKVAELYIVDNLPHGFLNFQVFSNEAREACDLIIACLKKTLRMGMRSEDSSVNLARTYSRKE